MFTRSVLFLSVVAACGDPAPVDPCLVEPTGLTATVELGLGDPFVPVIAGADVPVQVGLQGLYMFVVNARVRDLAVADGEAGVRVFATSATGQAMDLESGCRARGFVDAGDGSYGFDSPYLLALLPEFTPTLDGASVTLHVDVVDLDGNHASDQRAIVARTSPGTP